MALRRDPLAGHSLWAAGQACRLLRQRQQATQCLIDSLAIRECLGQRCLSTDDGDDPEHRKGYRVRGGKDAELAQEM